MKWNLGSKSCLTLILMDKKIISKKGLPTAKASIKSYQKHLPLEKQVREPRPESFRCATWVELPSMRQNI